MSEPLSAALAEELAKALNAEGWTCFEGSHEPGNYNSCADCRHVCNEHVAALTPILSRALAEAWDAGFDAGYDRVLVEKSIAEPMTDLRVNPYLTEKEQSQ